MTHFELLPSIFFGVATLQGILLLINLLLFQKGGKIANYFLGGLIISITLIVFQNFIVFSGYYTKIPHIISLFWPLNGLIGPLFLFYVLYLITPNRKFKKYDVLHLALFFYMCYEHINFIALKGEYKIATAEYLYYQNTNFNAFFMPSLLLRRIIIIGYALLALYLIINTIKKIKNETSNTNLQYLLKFKSVSYLFIAYALSSFIGQLYSYVFEVYIGRYEVYHHLLNSSIILILSVVAMQQPERLQFVLQPISLKKKNTNPKHQIDIIELRHLMSSQQPYLNPDLKLHDLAQLLNTPPHILSNTINKELEMNFFEFVNRYRVEEFKQRVSSSDFKNYSFLAIALDVGFNSKASFNRIFKKETGITPTQYTKQQVSTS